MEIDKKDREIDKFREIYCRYALLTSKLTRFNLEVELEI
jgi:hypothetical protein